MFQTRKLAVTCIASFIIVEWISLEKERVLMNFSNQAFSGSDTFLSRLIVCFLLAEMVAFGFIKCRVDGRRSNYY